MKVFIATYGGGHVTMAIPVIKELQQRGHDTVTLALTTAGEAMAHAGLSHFRPIDFIDKDDSQIRKYGEQLVTRHHTEGKGISREESIACLGVSYKDLVCDVGEEKASALYKEKALNAFCPVHFLTRVLREISPDIVMATTSPRMEMATLRAAYGLNMPSICMVDLFAILELSWLSRPDNGDYLTVYSDKVKQRLVAAGRPASRVVVTGNPAFDSLADSNILEEGKKLRKMKGVSGDEKLVLWAEQPEPLEPDLPRDVRFHLGDICRKHPRWKLITRLHPSSTDPVKEVIPPDVLVSPSHESLPALLSACDAVVTLTSTVAMEALLMNKPVLIIRISPYRHLVDYSKDDGAMIIETLGEAELGLERLFNDPILQNELAEQRSRLPKIGYAASRICDHVERPDVLTRQLAGRDSNSESAH